MIFNTQTDDKWKNECMALLEDKIGRWGCLVSVIANIIQDCNRKKITPKDLNDWIKDHKLYLYDIEGQESCLKTDIVLDKWGLKKINNTDYIANENYYYYARVLTSWGGHYINVIAKNKHYICFDVWDGKLKTYKPNQIQNLYRVEKK